MTNERKYISAKRTFNCIDRFLHTLRSLREFKAPLENSHESETIEMRHLLDIDNHYKKSRESFIISLYHELLSLCTSIRSFSSNNLSFHQVRRNVQYSAHPPDRFDFYTLLNCGCNDWVHSIYISSVKRLHRVRVPGGHPGLCHTRPG